MRKQLTSEQKEKAKERAKKWYLDNKEKALETRKIYSKKTKNERKIRDKIYRENNKEKIKNWNSSYIENNKDKFNELNKNSSKKYRLKNVEKLKDYSKNYREKNKEIIKHRIKIWRLNNKDYLKIKISTNNLFKLKCRVRTMIYKSLYHKKFYKKKTSCEILGCSFEEFKKYMESNFEPWMTWENYGNPKDGIYELNKTWDIDHIIPLAITETEEDIIKLNHYTNLQPLCSYNNRFIKKDDTRNF
jgi:hypothetical protein